MRSTASISLLLLAAMTSVTRADDVPERHVESVTLNVETRATKRMGAVRDFLAEQQWARAIDLLHEIASESDGALVRVEPGRYVGVRRSVNLVLCGLPVEGLMAYREQVDPQTIARFERAMSQRDAPVLRRLVRDHFIAPSADEALLLLGDLAFETGDLAAARSYWTKLVPLPGEFPVGELRPRLRYPDADVPLPDVLARLIAATIVAGDHERATGELAYFAERFPDEQGQLFGTTGRYVETLRLLNERSSPELGDSDRGAGAGPQAVAGIAWSATVPVTSLPIPVARPVLVDRGPLTTHPAMWQNVVLAAGEDRIVAWNANSGLPWPDADDTAVLYRTSQPVPFPQRPIAGVPRFTLALDDGLLYARMGSPVTGKGANELADLGSEIVCLDLAGAEGNLLARITPREVTGESGWAFEGSPVVRDGRLFTLLRRVDPQMEIAAARLVVRPRGERDHGFEVQWFERVCGALQRVDDNLDVVTHLRPTLAGGQLFVSTDLGGIVALDAETGQPDWAVTYESHAIENLEAASDHTRVGLLPPVVAGNRVLVAPNDSDDLFALDRHSGRILWRRSLPDRIRHLLGVTEDRLIASGNSLWALDVRTGHVVWAKRRFEPESFGYGRGMLADGMVWWPQREGIAVVRQRDGQPANGDPLPHWIDLVRRGGTGGNLATIGGRLVVTEPHRVVVYDSNPEP